MKIFNAVILSALLLLFAACAHHVNDPADVQAIKKSLDDYSKAVNAGDVDAVVAGMTDTAHYAPPNMPVTVGKEANRSLYQAFFNLGKPEFSLAVEDVRVAGDLGVARGTFTEKVMPKAQGVAPFSDKGNWIVVFARQNDGSWKWDWCVPTSSQPAPGSTASGEDEKALYQLETEWGEAALKKDVARLDALLAPEFQSSYATTPGNKKQYLATLKNDVTKIESLEVSDMKAFVLGDRAIVEGISTEKSSLAGKDTSGQYRWTDVWVKRDGKWLCVMGYATKVK